jgi:hypothetical protein
MKRRISKSGSADVAVLASASSQRNDNQAINPYDLLRALQAVKLGDFSVRLSSDGAGVESKIAEVFNDIVATNQRMAKQLEQVGQTVGREGRTRQRV